MPDLAIAPTAAQYVSDFRPLVQALGGDVEAVGKTAWASFDAGKGEVAATIMRQEDVPTHAGKLATVIVEGENGVRYPQPSASRDDITSALNRLPGLGNAKFSVGPSNSAPGGALGGQAILTVDAQTADVAELSRRFLKDQVGGAEIVMVEPSTVFFP